MEPESLLQKPSYPSEHLYSLHNWDAPSIQLDRFLSTGLGDYSFQINQIGSQSAYCLFSEVTLSALRGEVKEAIDTEDHRFKPVVTNHKLAEYLGFAE
ncbi:hypothetical protein [Microcystis aeruginosa]|uniref:hypothetical protein n=1 Tax=Microcystis aeruginosa TaxID=1126 RepID=UPI001F222867|nr:hypothetical protein [Microcystis aeruginosa]